MSVIKLEDARTIIAQAFAEGRKLGLKPLSVAVLDAGGHLVAFEREDSSSTLRPQIAIGKASGALGLGVSSRKIGEMAQERPTFIGALGPIAPAGIIPAAGGLVIVDDDGNAIGAVGVTGDVSDNDELCAIAGLRAAGLKWRE